MPATSSSSRRLRLGCCGSMIAPAIDPAGVEIVEPLAALGFDYVELSLRDLVALPEASFAALARRLDRAGLKCEACNNFFPPEIRLTGHEAQLPSILAYAQRAFSLAARLGVAVVVFGSSGARDVPAGFPAENAWRQLRALLAALGPLAEAHRLTIAIEHLNRGESNILNTLAESARMMREVGHPRVRLLADSYHLLQEHEPTAIVADVGSCLAHVHIAQGHERVFPTAEDPVLVDFFGQLHTAGYAGRCSIEAFTPDFAADAARALGICRDLAAPFAT